ncbi:MAG: TOMM precursor leader peptide-binding protein [Gaiella sp.]|nr:TOMM precursor leader peptide-binding protein [Gaiella sp.]
MIPTTAPGSALPRHPALAPWCRLVEDGTRVLLEHGGTVVTLEGAAARSLLPRLLPLLDGTRTVEELGAVLGPAIAPAIEKTLALLAENQLLAEGPFSLDSDVGAAATYVAAVTRSTTQAAAVEALEGAQVTVLGKGATADELARQLAAAGIPTLATLPLEAETDPGSFVVAAPGHDELPALLRVNERALEHREPWLQVLPYDGRFVVAGPVFVPGASACRACFVTRRAAASGFEVDFDLVERVPRRTPPPAALVSIASALATVLVVRWLTTRDPTLPGRFYALEAGTVVRLRFDQLLRVPRCELCGAHARAVPSPWFEAPS